MGFEPPPWPSNWLYPAASGYAATLGDNGNILSSYNTQPGLAVTLPSTTGLPTGWSMGFATDNGKPLSVQVNGTSGGHIVWPGAGAASTSVALANTSQGAYEFLVLQYDGSGNFRVVGATPATAQAIGMIGNAVIQPLELPVDQRLCRDRRRQRQCGFELQQPNVLYGGDPAADHSDPDGLDHGAGDR